MCLGIDKRVRVYGKLIHLVGTLALEYGWSPMNQFKIGRKCWIPL